MIAAGYRRTLALANLILFNDEWSADTLPEPRCSRCGNGVPVCADVGLSCSEACLGFKSWMPVCWVCDKELAAEAGSEVGVHLLEGETP